jgi:alpha-tubulin suppressor-like RCC1 family protein
MEIKRIAVVGLIIIFAWTVLFGVISFPNDHLELTAENETAHGTRGVLEAEAISAGESFSLALLSDGTIRSWGKNVNGQLGDGTNIGSNESVSVSGMNNAIVISAGESFSLALLSDGTINSWGENVNGQLGDGTKIGRNAPVSVSGINNAINVSAGESHSLAVLSDGTIRSWGKNDHGQLGDGTTTEIPTPVTVSGVSDAQAVATGGWHSLALLDNGSVMSWGSNTYGELGTGSGPNDQTTPVFVLGINNAIAIAAGDHFSMVLLDDGTILSWGSNKRGQLGDGTQISSNTPVSVSGINTASAIAAGGISEDGHSLAVLSDGSIKSWGHNLNGQLGDGTTTGRLTPVDVSGISTAEDIAAGGSHSLAMLLDGKIMSWGNNLDGQLGDGTNNEKHTPQSVVDNDPPIASAGADITSGTAPLNVTFTGSGTDTDGSIASYGWDFGDGNTSSEQNPAYTYDNDGTYDVTLTVTDDEGATGEDSLTIIVTETPGDNDPPVASAGADITSGEAPMNVTFTGSGTDSDGSIVSYGWDFGDGNTSSEQNPTYTFDSTGTYTVTLTVTDDDGATGEDSLTITVNEAPDDNGDDDNGGLCGTVIILLPIMLFVGVVMQKERK